MEEVKASDLDSRHVPSPIRREVLDRLLLAKFFLDRIRFQPIATHDRESIAAAIISAHDSAELAIAAIASQLGFLPKNRGNAYLMDYFDPIVQGARMEVFGREYFSQLNRVRNNLKHEGLYPDAAQWSRVAEMVFQNVTKWCRDFLNINFSSLDNSALIANEDAKAQYLRARVEAEQGNFKAALETVAVALSIVFRENAALRGLTAGRASSEDAIRLSGFGVHANDFLALQEFLPLVESYGDNAGKPQWRQSGFGHPGNWRENAVQFCLRTFVDVTVKIQDANWIPGAISLYSLYEQEIVPVLESVDIWMETKRDRNGRVLVGFEALSLGATTEREVVKTLKRGESLKCNVSVMKESSGDRLRDALMGGGVKSGRLLSVLATVSEKYIHGYVEASEVKVLCVPRSDEWIKEAFPHLPTTEWEPE